MNRTRFGIGCCEESNGSMQKCITCMAFATVMPGLLPGNIVNATLTVIVFRRKLHRQEITKIYAFAFVLRERKRKRRNEDQVLRELRLDPSISQRQISRNLGIPRSTVQRVINRNKLHAVQRVQALLPSDYEPRVRFCREMLKYNREDLQFFNKVLWTVFFSYFRNKMGKHKDVDKELRRLRRKLQKLEEKTKG
ncbi:hypothetical protein HW555_000436 [Spodoptera exigua]|uniref:HTH cro/C1-type domain-containing protein n=1 Tax=Spodoptera exigua TaxID=7107 RepID=A0A835LB97_SPOEX|nr:hypothetical protein HW555_000436 [Spodoptera exigua]